MIILIVQSILVIVLDCYKVNELSLHRHRKTETNHKQWMQLDIFPTTREDFRMAM